MSGNVHTVGQLVDRDRPTGKYQAMSTHSDIWQTEAELPLNVSKYPLIWTIDGPSYQ